jgi:hypothetical protein
MTVAINDIIRVTAVMDHSLEGTVQNVWYAKQYTDTATDAQFISGASGRLDTMYGYIDNFMPDTLTFEEIRFFNVTQSAPMATSSWPSLVDGDVDVGHPLPSVMSCLMFTRTAANRVILRKFFGPFTEENQQDAEWTTGITNAIATGMILWFAAWTSGAGVAQGGVWSPTNALFYEATTTVVRSVPAYQRRRKRGRGA